MDIDSHLVLGLIRQESNFNDKAIAIEKLNDAVRRANNARNAESGNDIEKAIYWWNKVYNDLFPSYY